MEIIFVLLGAFLGINLTLLLGKLFRAALSSDSGSSATSLEKPKRSEEDGEDLDALLEEKPKRGLFTLGTDGELTPYYTPNEEENNAAVD